MTFEAVWFALGFGGWLFFIYLMEPDDATEWVIAIVVLSACIALGPISILAVAIMNKIDPPVKRS